jgi:hypothetical protein
MFFVCFLRYCSSNVRTAKDCILGFVSNSPNLLRISEHFLGHVMSVDEGEVMGEDTRREVLVESQVEGGTESAVKGVAAH